MAIPYTSDPQPARAAERPVRARWLSDGPGPGTATIVFLALTIVMTWPLATGLLRDLPHDLGDSVLNCWILGWDLHHLTGFFTGHLTALGGYWNANIFYPAPLALAYSEHLTGEALQALPVYVLTGNLVLCYNLLFLSTFVLSGLGMYLFVREAAGRAWPALIAGLVYAFLPYRAAQLPHLQVLSSQWMPFALYGLLRYFRTRRRAPLAGAAAAIVAQNLSCGYYLIFFTIPLVLFVLGQIAARRLWRETRIWTDLLVAGLAVAVATMPFLWPYLELRALGERPWSLRTIVGYSADTWSYFTSSTSLNLWGGVMKALPKPEGELFLGVTAWALALVGMIAGGWSAWRESTGIHTGSFWRRAVAVAAVVVLIAYVAVGVVLLAGGPVMGDTPIGFVRLTSASRVLWTIGLAFAVLPFASARARRVTAGYAGSLPGLLSVLLVVSVWMSFGPILNVHGEALAGGALYDLFYRLVPGFDGLRVPARCVMVAAVFLAALAGFGAAAIERRRFGTLCLLAAGVFIVVEGAALPITLNERSEAFDHRIAEAPRGPLPAPRDFPPVYRFIAELPPGTAIAELPFGEDALERYYMYFSTAHWHPLLNGYSGEFPAVYLAHRAALRHVLDDPDKAWAVLVVSGVRYIVLHKAYYAGGRGPIVERWLLDHDARPLATFGSDIVFALPPPPEPRAAD